MFKHKKDTTNSNVRKFSPISKINENSANKKNTKTNLTVDNMNCINPALLFMTSLEDLKRRIDYSMKYLRIKYYPINNSDINFSCERHGNKFDIKIVNYKMNEDQGCYYIKIKLKQTNVPSKELLSNFVVAMNNC